MAISVFCNFPRYTEVPTFFDGLKLSVALLRSLNWKIIGPSESISRMLVREVALADDRRDSLLEFVVLLVSSRLLSSGTLGFDLGLGVGADSEGACFFTLALFTRHMLASKIGYFLHTYDDNCEHF